MVETTLGEFVASHGGFIQTGPFGSQLHASAYVLEGIPVVMPANLSGGRITYSKTLARISKNSANNLERHKCATNDILYSRRGDITQRALVRQEDGLVLCGTGCLRIHFGTVADFWIRFIFHQLASSRVHTWLEQHAVGATMLNLNTQILQNLPLHIPTATKARNIERLLTALDDKIEANTKLASKADELAQAIFLQASRSSKRVSTFEEIANVNGGGTPKTSVDDYWNGGINWATPTDITALDQPYLFRTSRTLTEAGLENCASTLYPPGTILMTSRATVGAFALAQVPTAVNQGFITVQAKDPALQTWLYFNMRSRTEEFKSWANGATFLELSRGNFKRLPVRLPDIETLSYFNSSTKDLLALAVSLVKENQHLAQLRDYFLPRLMSGKIKVRAADNSAEAPL